MVNQKATVFHPETGERKQVTIGDPKAFEGGFQLETRDPESLKDTMPDLPKAKVSDTLSNFTAFKDVMRTAVRSAQAQQPDIQSVLENFRKQVGVEGAISPDIAGAVVSGAGARQVRNIEDIYAGAMDRIDLMEKTKIEQQENINNFIQDMAEAGLMSNITGEMLDNIRMTGVIPTEALQVINQAAIEKRMEPSKPPTISEQIKAYESGGRIIDNRFIPADSLNDPITKAPTDESKIIEGYNFTSYATDPNWGHGVKSILSSMPSLANASDIDGYIQSVAPNSSVLGSEIMEVARQSGIDPEMMIAIMQQESQLGTAGAGARGNNPANIGNTDQMMRSGQIFAFDTMRDGIEALAKNIQQRRITKKELTPVKVTERDLLRTTSEEDEFITRVIRLLPQKLKDSEGEREARMVEALRDYRAGKSLQQVVDEIKGFVITNEEEQQLANNLRVLAAGTDLDLSQIASPINLGEPIKAMTVVENANLEMPDKDFKDIIIAQTVMRKSNEVLGLLDVVPAEYFGFLDRKIDKWTMKLPEVAKREDQQRANRVAALLTDINKDIRKRYLGSAITETEAKFLEDFLADMEGQPATIKVMLTELQDSVLLSHNTARNIMNLPQINSDQLLDNRLRLLVYRNLSERSAKLKGSYVQDDVLGIKNGEALLEIPEDFDPNQDTLNLF